MPRTSRASVGGVCYHVLNRGNGRAAVCHDDADYATFLTLLRQAGERGPVPRPAHCLKRVNAPITDAELAAVRLNSIRGWPFGAPAWRKRTATRLGLESSLRPRGRPAATEK